MQTIVLGVLIFSCIKYANKLSVCFTGDYFRKWIFSFFRKYHHGLKV